MDAQGHVALLVWGELPVLKDAKLDSHVFTGLDCLLLCRFSTQNISVGITLSPIPTPHMLNLPCLIYMPCLFDPSFIEDFPLGLTDVMEDSYGDDGLCQVLLIHIKVHAKSPPVHLEVVKTALQCPAGPAQAEV